MPFGSEVSEEYLEKLSPRMRKQIEEIYSDDNVYFTGEALAKKGINFDDLDEAKKREALAEHYLESRAADSFDQRHPELREKDK